tara:strand:- start:2590 stop:2739 length:150 start_codon:yes stop_codon:yes gene_type:complete
MTKKKKLVKKTIKKPGFYTLGGLAFFQVWLKHRKERKAARMLEAQENNS